MPIVKSEAFILKSFRYGETSKIVTIFSKQLGKINAVVKGARNFKSRICGTLESMNYIEAVIYFKENRDLQLISSAEYKRSFPGILNDFNKLQLAYRIIEMTNKSMIQNEASMRVFDLIIDTFENIESSSVNLLSNLLVFQLKLINLLGLNPDFSLNKNCEYETFFNYNELNLNNEQVDLIQKIEYSNLNNENLKIDETKMTTIIECYEKYLLYHTVGSKSYNSNKVFKQINQYN